jgi:hypothetical protein
VRIKAARMDGQAPVKYEETALLVGSDETQTTSATGSCTKYLREGMTMFRGTGRPAVHLSLKGSRILAISIVSTNRHEARGEFQTDPLPVPPQVAGVNFVSSGIHIQLSCCERYCVAATD